VRKLVRSALVRAPRFYEFATAQWRYRTLYRLGAVHEPEFRALPLLVQRPDALVLDVGANRGQSILSIKRVLPQARVISFEPASCHAGELNAVAARLPDVGLQACALSDASGEAELCWPVYNGMSMHALASLDRDEALGWIGPTSIYGFDGRRLELQTERVTLRRLDDLELEPDVIKIDVQGTEACVLAGGLETIARTRPAVMAESLEEGGAAHAVLAGLDYVVATFRKGRFERGSSAYALNRFLLPAERLSSLPIG
jgi:FkbM family methyltransferase